MKRIKSRIRHMILEENSRSMISRVVYPVVNAGIHGDAMLSLICMHITAPMKKEMSSTIPILSTPRAVISLIYCLRNMRHLSGTDITLPIRHRYSPNFVMLFVKNIFIANLLVQRYAFSRIKEGAKVIICPPEGFFRKH